jgi:hypothetical protein
MGGMDPVVQNKRGGGGGRKAGPVIRPSSPSTRAQGSQYDPSSVCTSYVFYSHAGVDASDADLLFGGKASRKELPSPQSGPGD